MTVLLAHSPLLAAGATWGGLPALLGEPVLVPDVRTDEIQPYAASYVAALLGQVRPRWPVRSAVTVVAHSGAGPLLGALLAALRSAGTPVAEAIFLDAGLPTACLPGLPAQASRFDLLDAENPAAGDSLRAQLSRGGRFPNWTAEQLGTLVPEPAAVLAGMRPRGADFFAEPLPTGMLPDRLRCGYIQLSETYQPYADRAADLGWPVLRAPLHHFAPLTDPDAVAGLIRQVRHR
ncbi:MAG TPA: hypothetical protein VMU51_14170 [Mycobacteriales bacterium]|nr:hypothetical protein [Mycobacteriales bacterium]